MTCSVDPASKRLMVSADGNSDPWLVRSGEVVVVRDGPAPVPCGGPAGTVRTLDAIEMSGDSDAATIDLSGGPFAPGASGESDSPEIEITVTGDNEVIVLGSPGPDSFTSATMKTEADTGLNAAEDADPDLVLRSTDYQSSPFFFGGAGDDVIRFITGSVSGALGGGGNDLISAAPRSLSIFAGGRGADRLIGSSGPDTMNAGPGPDLLIGGKGDDGLEAAGEGRDRIRCGPGKDLYGADRRDRRKSCERDFKTVPRPKLPKLP